MSFTYGRSKERGPASQYLWLITVASIAVAAYMYFEPVILSSR